MSWSILILLTVVAMQICIGEKPCVIWSTAGSVIQRGRSFQVFCVFKNTCEFHMEDSPSTEQEPILFNSTTLYLNVSNIAKDKTYCCECKNHPALDPCGLDISTGDPPDPPKNVSCIYKIDRNQSEVFCSWDRGRETNLKTDSDLWVTTLPGDKSHGPRSYTADGSASFNVSKSVQNISVWVQAKNKLATVNSRIFNYTLSDIAKPSTPVLGQPECLSQTCNIRVEQSMRTEHLEIQYKADQETWETLQTNSDMQMDSSVWSIGALEPFRLYHFKARSKFSTGLWSDWSTITSSWTEEEAPAKELDVWFTESESDTQSMRVYWKEANISISRGKIVEYIVGVDRSNTSLSADVKNYSISHCAKCEVTIWARNSKGLSPPAKIKTRRTTGNPPQGVRVTQSNNSVSIFWRTPETAASPSGYVVEWYPQGHRLEELRWLRLGSSNHHAVISDMKPLECYEGAVYDLQQDRSGSGTKFTAVAISESVPASGPVIQDKVDGNEVKLTWTELPRSERRGCITNYTFYLKNDSGNLRKFSEAASKRTHIISGLSPGVYTLWMSASTAKGEGPNSTKVKFFIQQETPLSSLLVCIVASAVVLLLLCLCQSSSVKQRFWEIFQCIMLDVVPDPANSKWAKECSQEKGKINLQLQLSNATETEEEEEEPILVDVEELPRQSDDTSALKLISSQPPPETSLKQDAEPTTLPYPLTTYIKSLSHDSDSSDQTHTSMDTNTTVDYISSHGPEILDEDGEDEEREEEFADVNFFPCQNIFMEPLEFGGKLTLDAVKIDCSNFFQNCDG